MRLSLQALQRDESGDSLVEYALLIACLSMAAVLAIHTLGARIFGLFGPTNAAIGWFR